MDPDPQLAVLQQQVVALEHQVAALEAEAVELRHQALLDRDQAIRLERMLEQAPISAEQVERKLDEFQATRTYRLGRAMALPYRVARLLYRELRSRQ